MPMQMLAAIDVGSSEVAMKIYQFSKRTGIEEIEYVRSIVELGADTYNTGVTQSAAHIAAGITIVGTFGGIRLNPRLANKEVVRQVDLLTLGVLHLLNARQFTKVKLPSCIQAYRISHCGCRFTYEHCHSRQNNYFLHSSVFILHL